MKKVFLVRKDVTKPYGKDNWQIMGLDEFRKFKETDAAKGRTFIRLFDYDSHGDVIFKECEPSEKAQRNKELSLCRRKIDYIKKHNITEMRYSLVKIDDEWVSSEQLVPDESADVEEIVGRKLMVEKLREALKHLTPDEQRIIELFFFSEEGKSVRKIAEELGVPFTTLQDRKAAILNKLRNFL